MRIDGLNNFSPATPTHPRGAVLLEVVFAMALFFLTATFVMNGLNGSLGAVRTAQLEASAADLSVTVLSEIQLGLIPLSNDGPVAIDLKGYEDWTWQLIVNDAANGVDIPELKQIEVVLSHNVESFTHRSTHMIWNDPNRGLPPEEDPDLGDLGDLTGGLP